MLSSHTTPMTNVLIPAITATVSDSSAKRIFDRVTYLDFSCYILLKEFRGHCKQHTGVEKWHNGGIRRRGY